MGIENFQKVNKMAKGELQQHFEKIMSVPINAPVKVIASAQLKMQLKMLLAISMIFEKVKIQEVLDLYIKFGGNKKDIETFLKK
jgi:hypothetical protein